MSRFHAARPRRIAQASTRRGVLSKMDGKKVDVTARTV
jgi:hypothetical protein